MSRADAARRRAARRLLHDRDAEPASPALHLIASYGFGGRKSLSNAYQLEGEPHRPVRVREEAHPPRPTCPDDFIYIATGHGRGAAAQRRRPARPLRGRDARRSSSSRRSRPFSPNHLTFLDQLMDSIGVILNMISSSMRTEELLQQLKRSNAELEAQAGELNDKAKLLEVKNQRGRAREPEPRGEGRAAPAHLEVQVASSSRTCRTSCGRR